ncbi:MAG TPA: hypothetical protein VFX80_02380 [Solirubrobacteraceae bacterium]|nr:hypothetical protein [Solirubrobacteraceae bacterium]
MRDKQTKAEEPRELRSDQKNDKIIMLLAEILEELKAQTAVMPQAPAAERNG